MKNNIESLWKEMENKQDHVFYTKRHLPFTIRKKNENYFDVYRDDKKARPISKTDMEFIINNPNEKRYVYRDKMNCSSYALAIYFELYEDSLKR